MGDVNNSIKLNINGKELVLDLSKIKDKVYRNEFTDNQNVLGIFDYFNYYDTSETSNLSRTDTKSENSSIFGQAQEDEILSVFESLREAAGDDGCLDETEASNFLQGISNLQDFGVEDLFKFISILMGPAKQQESRNVPQMPTSVKKTDAEVRQDVINILHQDSIQTLELLDSQNPGAVTKFYDNAKEYFNIGLSNAKVYEAAINEAKASKYLALVQEGKLTRSEYVTANKNRLKDMIKARLYRKDSEGNNYILNYCKKNHLKPEQFEKLMLATIDRECDNQSIEYIKNLMRQLSQTTDSGDKYILDKIKDKAISSRSSQAGGTKYADDSFGMINDNTGLTKPDDGKPLTFEEVFLYEHGVPYNKDACEEYQTDYSTMLRQIGAYNKYASFIELKNGIQSNDDAQIALNKMVQLFKSYYDVDGTPNLAFNKLKEIIQSNKLPINVSLHEGEIALSVEIGSEELMRGYVDTIVDSLQKDLETRLEAFIGDNPTKVMEEQSNKVNTSHLKAFGGDFSSVLAKELIEDNNSVIKTGTAYLKEGGMYCASVGGFLCMTPINPVGSAMTTLGGLSMTAGVAIDGFLSAIEANTRAVQSDEEKENVVKDVITDAGGMIVGYFASKAGLNRFNKIIDKKLAVVLKTEINNGNKAAALKTVFKSPATLKNFMSAAGTKISTDVLLSYTGDLVMMGVLDTNEDWYSLLKANLMGAVMGTTMEMSGFAKNASQSYKVDTKQKVSAVQQPNFGAKIKNYLNTTMQSIEEKVSENYTYKSIKSAKDKAHILSKLKIEKADIRVKNVINTLLDYDIDYAQLKQIADILQSDIKAMETKASDLRRGNGIRKPKLVQEFGHLPDFLDRFVNDLTFPLKELGERQGYLTELAQKALSDPDFPVKDMLLLLQSQTGRINNMSWDTAIDVIKNGKKSSLFNGNPPVISEQRVLVDISNGYYTKENLDLIRQLVNDTTTDVSILSTIYKSIEFATLGANIPKISGYLDKTNSIENLSGILKELDRMSIPDKYKSQVAQLKQQVTNQLKNYLENALEQLNDADMNVIGLYERILNEFEGKIDLPISRSELENMKRLAKTSQRYDKTATLSRKQRVDAINQEILSINNKITKYLSKKSNVNKEKAVEFEQAIEQFKNMDNIYKNDNWNVEARINIYKQLAKYIKDEKYNFSRELSSLETIYMKEDFFTASQMQNYNQNLDASQKEYNNASSVAIENLKISMAKIIDSLK